LTLFQFLSQYYYTVGLLILIELVALAVSIKNYRRHRTLRVFTYYTIFSLTEIWGQFIQMNLGDTTLLRNINGGFTNVFMIFEFILCIVIIVRHLSSKARRTAVLIDALLFGAVLTADVIRHPHFLYSEVFFFSESFFLLLPCLLYIYDLFVSAPAGRLRDEPSFWIITGFLILNACSIPMYITGGFSGSYQTALFSLNFILYSVLFILLIRAYSCPPENRATHART